MTAVFESTVPTPVSNTPKNIEWIKQEDDIPSIEEALGEALSQEQIPVVPMSALGRNAPTAVPNILKNVETIEIEDDISTLEETFEALSREQMSAVTSMPVGAQDSAEAAAIQLEEIEVTGPSNESLPAKNPVVVPVFEPEPEEITLVTPPRRITIDWEQPKPWETLSKEIEFFPTLLGDVDTKRKAEHTSEPFFSDYYDEAEPRSSDHYRSLLIGSGFIVLIVLFLFGNDSVWTYLQGGSAADSVAVQTSPAKQTFSPSGQTIMPSDQRQLKSDEKAKMDDDIDTGVLKSGTIKIGASTSDDTVSAPTESKSVEPNKQKPSKNSERNAGKTPLVPSTLVISSDDGKISSKVEPQKRKATESTRPRIVENPQP